MRLDELRKIKTKLYQLAAKYGIRKLYVFGSVARGESSELSDIDFLIEMESDASAFGIGAFQYEAQKMLGIEIDVVPTFTLDKVDDKDFVRAIQTEAVSL